MYELHCNGNESTIWNCSYTDTVASGQSCYVSNQASVYCMCKYYMIMILILFWLILAASTQYVDCTDGRVRLVGGSTVNKGNVQICYNNAWGSVCDDSWDTSDGNVVCRQLGYSSAGMCVFHHVYVTLK